METIAGSFAQNIPNSEEICSVCGAKILRTAEFMGIKRTFRVMCKCMQKQQEEEKIRQESGESGNIALCGGRGDVERFKAGGRKKEPVV